MSTPCGMDSTVKQTGEEGECIFCQHETKHGTPWPEGGVVCPCGSCLARGIAIRQGRDPATMQAAAFLGSRPDSPYVPEPAAKGESQC